MQAERKARPRLIGFALLAGLGTFALIVGLIASVGAKEPAERSVATTALALAFVLLGIAAVIFIRDVAKQGRDWLRDHFPSQARKDHIAAEASRLGLRSVAGDDALVRLRLPFRFADDIRSIDRIFVGSWRGHDLRIFDCSRAVDTWAAEERLEDWTCVVMPLSSSARLEVTRENALTRIKSIVGWKVLDVGDESFDRAFHISSDDDEAARRMLDERVRSRLMEDAPDRVAIELTRKRMLYCSGRLQIEERVLLLDVATRLGEVLRRS